MELVIARNAQPEHVPSGRGVAGPALTALRRRHARALAKWVARSGYIIRSSRDQFDAPGALDGRGYCRSVWYYHRR